jgi:hypothetical protein
MRAHSVDRVTIDRGEQMQRLVRAHREVFRPIDRDAIDDIDLQSAIVVCVAFKRDVSPSGSSASLGLGFGRDD